MSGDYCVYYGPRTTRVIKQMNAYQSLIVEPTSGWTKDDLEYWRSQGKTIYGYLNVGETDFPDQVKKSWILGRNRAWHSLYMDAGNPEYQAYVMGLARAVLAQGYTGIFMDTVDTAELYPQSKPGMAELIKELFDLSPHLIQNRGFVVLPETQKHISILMYEDFAGAGREEAEAFKKGYPSLSVFTLDYATDGHHARDAAKLADELGWVSYIAPSVALDRVTSKGTKEHV